MIRRGQRGSPKFRKELVKNASLWCWQLPTVHRTSRADDSYKVSSIPETELAPARDATSLSFLALRTSIWFLLARTMSCEER
jgi:hypothetical protein